ncbi:MULTISPECIES: adenosylcobinamide-phosphate synthase CbiB [Sphingomonadaceae]|jgi:adenosylcobinamide-phosphate synthase|uniref:Cobalamin biosynthesis protein CobD n=1 Tax=Novosphingobium aromaticivorans (strain ATCC 700278 / DSM 12444 / CCUG 56034 / CIP 105152 / NBRC 16084 / F199) TaxID=279238 RepID=Q2GBK1_NOVAD|nr:MULTISPECIES: adenosylcobinamide-phosphate synthase CbiB [Sphingomonadaceae]MAF29736.1 cobalamin biosynthesis protein CobD [Croceicoccus sp.]MEA3262268.1 adenosylcobinamide-phosphate synthase CbiB [Pseudomonadota bacterium]OYX47404.1 MAG: cobalamin biosynthesis protein CobD [Sphingomonadales bacterium 32-64-22]ABD24772.1 adenosylcobinamide-phosphate synthase [Novosphingobium aromaticivorans DSM 12444]ALC14617.1 adenosylcobinamide-phosphate synthase [Sphingopyxis sp. 113P3]
MIDLTAFLALVLDAAVGWPQPLYRRIGHPVGIFARIIAALERRWNVPSRSDGQRRMAGAVTVLILLGMAGGAGWVLQSLLVAIAGPWAWPLIAVLAWPGLAQRSLYDHVRLVADALERQDLPAARATVGMIVGRDTAALDDAGVARAAIESLAESFCDGVVAPLFWLLVLGLPGIWAYKAINTADSMIGHREERWRAYGWAAARTDDAMNLIPARLSGLLICLCGGGGWRILWRDASRHASPNAGWPEAAMAGALGLRLAGPIAYDGILSDKLWIGEGDRPARTEDIWRGLGIYARACLCLWFMAAGIAGGAAWAL